MISAPASQALLARTALRSIRTTASHTRLASAILVTASIHGIRSFSASVLHRQAAVVDTPSSSSSSSSSSSTITTTPDSAADIDDAPIKTTKTDFPVTTMGRKKRNKRTITARDKARFLSKWGWFDPDTPLAKRLSSLIGSGRIDMPESILTRYQEARSFRSARARLWTPTLEQIQAFDSTSIFNPATWIEKQIKARRIWLQRFDAEAKARAVEKARRKAEEWARARAQALAEAKADPNYDPEVEFEYPKYKPLKVQVVSQVELWDQMDYEQQVDFALRPIWRALSEQEKSAALTRLRYECIRKLGWRQGYSSGYPRPESDSSHLPAELGLEGEQGWAAFRVLQAAEEKEAWQAWQLLTPEQKVAEEKSAWTLRDRSQVYLDDSDDSFILASPAPRWYRVPERAGELTFLPNTIVKLVKNHVPEGKEYDPFKATFRVPLSMHKHALRSYLLSIYGLKTTWARSSIYRSPVTRDVRTGKVISGKGRTYKKVEVGLLEPFLFPEVSPEFQKQHLLTSELDYERSRVYLKMTKTTRWRGKKSTEQYEEEIANKDAASYHNLDPLSSEGIKGDQKADGERFPRFMLKTKGLPTAKHGKILQLLSQEKKKKEERIEEMIRKFKQDVAAANNFSA
ncbi:hypothetical protein NDA13_001001 [Ustilago tritici]|nr:hypothetical protein NDA13_001001 [Ustilago tritici]